MQTRQLKAAQKQLQEFVDEFGPLLGRCERGHWCGMYVSGLLLDGERKSIEPMAARLEGGDEQSLQQFTNQSPWPHEPVQNHLMELMVKRTGVRSGTLVLDDTSLPKDGKHSVGVARQYCGALGKIANCQVVVSWQFAGKHAHFPLLGELYLPECWTDDKKRMKAAGVPERRFLFKKKWELALELLDQIRHKVPHKALTFDAGYGEIRELLSELDQRGEKFVAQVPESHSFWPADIALIEESKKMGRPRVYPAIKDRSLRPLTAEKWAEKLAENKRAWKKIWLKLQTEKVVRVAAVRVYEVINEAYYRPGPERWLLIERLSDGKTRYFVSSFPKDTSIKKMIRIAHEWWKVEQGYQQLKEELGLDHFEGRSWRGLHHHITLCYMAFGFLVLYEHSRSKKSASHTARRQTLSQSAHPNSPLPQVRHA